MQNAEVDGFGGSVRLVLPLAPAGANPLPAEV